MQDRFNEALRAEGLGQRYNGEHLRWLASGVPTIVSGILGPLKEGSLKAGEDNRPS
jgi:hypothetical protein